MLYVYVASIYARILELPRHSSHRVCHRQEPSCGDLACWQYNNWVAVITGHGALIGTYSEVSCSQWSGSDGSSEFTGACLSGESAANWPAVGCGNQGVPVFSRFPLQCG